MNTGRLQFRHFDGLFDSREQAYQYLTNIVDPTRGEDYRLSETLVGEPILVKYKDGNGNIQALVAVGTNGEPGQGAFAPYHIVDTAKLEEEIASLSGSSSGTSEELRHEIERAMAAEAALQDAIDAVEVGAGLESDGSYVPNDESKYIKEATSLKDADNKLDAELARVEKARKDVTGQDTDVYVPNESLVSRPIAYIADAESLNDADVKLDEAIQGLSKETVKNVEVDGVEGVIVNNVAVVGISGNSIPLGPYEEYEGRANQVHPIHDDYSVMEAIKQVDTNFIELAGSLNGKVEGLHLVKVTSGLDANVREAYDLVNKDGLPQENSARVLIYKDSSLYSVYLGHTDDRLEDYSSPVVTPGTGDTALCFIYLKVDGTYQLTAVNVQNFLQESEFLDGLRVDNHKVYVKIDPNSEEFLTVSPQGVKLAGVQAAIELAKGEIQDEINIVEAGAGLNSDGTYKTHDSQSEGMVYINTATSIDNATVLLDRGLKGEVDRATGAETIIDGKLLELSATTEVFSASTVSEVSRLDTKIDNETNRATTAEETINNKVDEFSAATITEIARIDEALTASTSDVNELSAATEGLSAATIAEVARLDGALSDTNNELNAVEAGAGLNGDGTYNQHHTGVSYINTANSIDEATVVLDNSLKAESDRAAAAEDSISATVNTFSAATVAEIARIDAAATRNKVKSTGETIVVTEATEGTNIEVNIDGKTILSNAGELKTGLKIVELPSSELEPNVREAFRLVDNEGNRINDTVVKIYKSSSLVSVQLVTIGGIDYVRITYIDNEGETQFMDLNIQELIFDAEFRDGLIVNGAGEVRVRIDSTSENFLTVSENGVKLSGVQNAINSAVLIEANRATAAETAIANDVAGLSAATVAFSSATVAEVARLDTKIETETTRATTAEEGLDARLDAIEAVTVSGQKAIAVDNAGATANKVITLVLDEDNVLTQSNNGLRTNLSLNYDSANQKVQLVGVGGTVISEFDSSDFVKDGMIQSVVFDPATQKLTITWNTAAGHDSTIIDLSSLVDVYTVESNSQKYLAIDNYVLSAKVNVTNGLAGYDKLVELSGNVETLESTFETPGSYRHTISDSMITSPTAGSAIAADKTLMRHYVEGGEKKYYVSSDSADMYYEGNKLSTEIATIENNITALSGGSEEIISELTETISEFSSATMSEISRLDTKIEDETTRATTAEAAIANDVVSLSAGTEAEIGRIEDILSENERVVSEAMNQIKAELDRAEEGAGLNGDGTYHKHNTAGDMGNYIATATSLDNATVLLDAALKAKEDELAELSASTASEIANLKNQLAEASGTIETLQTQLQTLSGAVETISAQTAANVYAAVKDILMGTSREIKVTADDTNETVTIGFADDAIFGPIVLGS